MWYSIISKPDLEVSNDLSKSCTLSSSLSLSLHSLHISTSNAMSVEIPADTGRRASHDAIDQGLTSEDDAAVLAQLGYKQELRR
jgi:hypothetical protein